MNEDVSQTEQSGESRSTPDLPPATEEKTIGYKPVTLRARKNTAWFFEKILKNEREHGLGTADASERALNELLHEQQGTSAQASKLEVLQKRVAELEEENQRLLVLTETSAEIKPVLADNEQIIVIEPQVLKLLNNVAKMRYAHERTRARWKLTEQESAGQLLMNCILTQEILFDYNACFYTGLTKEQFEQHLKGR